MPAEDRATDERHANNLELFLDLVFVFAITQVAILINEHLTAANVLEGVLMAFLVWWLWSQFTWAGSVVDLQGHTFTRVLVLCTIPPTLLMTVALPGALDDTSTWFAWSYLGVQCLVLAMQGAFTLQHAALRPAFVRYSTVALVSPVVVVIGAYLAGDVRVFTWAVAALIAIVAALRGGGGEWAINTTHFAERHALFVIIALGEVVVASGATTYLISEAHGLTGELVLAMSIAVGVAGLWWWTYFAYIPDVGERALRTTAPRARGALARDFYSFGHFPLVIGIVLLSVVVEHVLEHPSDALPATERWLLAAAVVAFTGGLVLLRVRLTKRWSPERLIAIGLTILLCAFGRELSGIAILGLVAVVQAISQGVRYWLYTREERASTNPS